METQNKDECDLYVINEGACIICAYFGICKATLNLIISGDE